MASIMQGTTPTITITVSTDDFLLSDVTAIDYKIKNGSNVWSYTLTDLTVDTTENTVSKTFTEAETSALTPKNNVIVQFRCQFNDGSWVGINPMKFSVADFIGI